MQYQSAQKIQNIIIEKVSINNIKGVIWLEHKNIGRL